MSKDTLTYKGYSTRPIYSIEDGIIIGKIEGVSDLISFECDSTDSEAVEAAFHEAVDDYLEACQAVGKTPDKPYKGSFNVRIDPALHRQVDQCAYQNGISMNQMIENIIRAYFQSSDTIMRGEEIGNASRYPVYPANIWNITGQRNNPSYQQIRNNFLGYNLPIERMVQ